MRLDTLGTLKDIRVSARYVVDDTVGLTYEEFKDDRKTRQLVERNFEIIGEAANRLRKRDPSVAERLSALNGIVALRNVLIHGYDAIDYQRVWWTIHESLPVLQAEVEAILKERGGSSSPSEENP